MPLPPKEVVMPKRDIGERVRRVRQAKGFTQARLAETLGTRDTNVSNIERGIRGLTVQQLVRLCKALKIPSDEILGLKESRSNGHIHDRRFLLRLQQIDKLSKRQKQALLQTLDTFLKGAGVA